MYKSTDKCCSVEGVWSLSSDFSPRYIPNGTFWADGAGRDFALGAYSALTNKTLTMALPKLSTYQILKGAIESACQHEAACGGEIRINSIQKDRMK